MARAHANSSWLAGLLAQTKTGKVAQIASIAGEEQLIVAQRLAHYPFVITASNTFAAALAEWRSATVYIASVAVLLILVIGAIVLLSIRQISNYEVLVKARAESDQRIALDAAINDMSQGLLMFDASERIVVCNRRYIEMYGLSPDVVKPGLAIRDLLAHRQERGTFTGDIDQYHRELRAGLAETKTFSRTVQVGDGRSIRIVNQAMANGGWVATHEDITERRKAELELERTKAFLDTVIENVPVTVFVKDVREQRYVLVNRAAEQLWGIPREDVIGKSALDLFPKQTADLILTRDGELLAHTGQLFHTTHQVETPHNGTRLVELRRIAILDEHGKPEYLLGVVEDVTERARADERIKYMAHHDLLTGLSNRALFMEKIEEAGARLRRRGETFTVFMLDLDRFKNVNDSLGHPEGDALLKETAQRLKSALRETDVLARLGGDEFAILQAGEANQWEDASSLADRIVEIMTKPYDINGNKVSIGTSIGIALAPADGIEPSELMKKADLALYRMKSEGRNGYRFFDAQMTADADALHRLEHDLREALLRDELEVHYQPIIDVKTCTPVGVEALVRWRHPQRGYIPPDQFIPLAEETGLIIPIGEFVLQRACADAAAWLPHIKVAVNLSLVQFRKGNLLDVILCALVESGLAPERLELEITELVLLENELEILAVIRQLKNSRRIAGPRRFRNRLLVAQLLDEVPVRQDQDRQVVHAEHGEAHGMRGHRGVGTRARVRPQHPDDGGGCRDRTAVRAAAHGEREPGPRVSVRAAVPGIRAGLDLDRHRQPRGKRGLRRLRHHDCPKERDRRARGRNRKQGDRTPGRVSAPSHGSVRIRPRSVSGRSGRAVRRRDDPARQGNR